MVHMVTKRDMFADRYVQVKYQKQGLWIFDDLCGCKCFLSWVIWMRCLLWSIAQDGLTGSAWGDWANYTASPLRAFENELGAQVGDGRFNWVVHML